MEYILAIIISGAVVGGVIFFFSQKKITKLNSDLQTEKEGRITAEQRNSRIWVNVIF